MNKLIAAASFVSLVAFAGVASAQDAPTANPAAPDQSATTNAGAADVGGTYAGSGASGGSMGLSRQAVRQQLINAERDGQIQQLNSTVYKGD
ncbi:MULTISPECIES: hypothetical protein [Paraburkholderia]|uniref:hypothetical protein n=1 Tax=Paraburkholderia TaxID=1822464 RepID=UPI0022516F34|nr:MULTISPECIES: hypothetical protein [Paraburkholderia]MCX4161541.1 hypothetical protein [Paraburkholderia megapolitana]MDN7157037.1 hypothetical protein [Paraburkholderia sp. CHISQ3]MDQ6494082.1 hypothetical protein [Paraburkholderia megapolitana]